MRFCKLVATEPGVWVEGWGNTTPPRSLFRDNKPLTVSVDEEEWSKVFERKLVSDLVVLAKKVLESVDSGNLLKASELFSEVKLPLQETFRVKPLFRCLFEEEEVVADKTRNSPFSSILKDIYPDVNERYICVVVLEIIFRSILNLEDSEDKRALMDHIKDKYSKENFQDLVCSFVGFLGGYCETFKDLLPECVARMKGFPDVLVFSCFAFPQGLEETSSQLSDTSWKTAGSFEFVNEDPRILNRTGSRKEEGLSVIDWVLTLSRGSVSDFMDILSCEEVSAPQMLKLEDVLKSDAQCLEVRTVEELTQFVKEARSFLDDQYAMLFSSETLAARLDGWLNVFSMDMYDLLIKLSEKVELSDDDCSCFQGLLSSLPSALSLDHRGVSYLIFKQCFSFYSLARKKELLGALSGRIKVHYGDVENLLNNLLALKKLSLLESGYLFRCVGSTEREVARTSYLNLDACWGKMEFVKNTIELVNTDAEKSFYRKKLKALEAEMHGMSMSVLKLMAFPEWSLDDVLAKLFRQQFVEKMRFHTQNSIDILRVVAHKYSESERSLSAAQSKDSQRMFKVRSLPNFPANSPDKSPYSRGLISHGSYTLVEFVAKVALEFLFSPDTVFRVPFSNLVFVPRRLTGIWTKCRVDPRTNLMVISRAPAAETLGVGPDSPSLTGFQIGSYPHSFLRTGILEYIPKNNSSDRQDYAKAAFSAGSFLLEAFCLAAQDATISGVRHSATGKGYRMTANMVALALHWSTTVKYFLGIDLGKLLPDQKKQALVSFVELNRLLELKMEVGVQKMILEDGGLTWLRSFKNVYQRLFSKEQRSLTFDNDELIRTWKDFIRTFGFPFPESQVEFRATKPNDLSDVCLDVLFALYYRGDGAVRSLLHSIGFEPFYNENYEEWRAYAEVKQYFDGGGPFLRESDPSSNIYKVIGDLFDKYQAKDFKVTTLLAIPEGIKDIHQFKLFLANLSKDEREKFCKQLHLQLDSGNSIWDDLESFLLKTIGKNHMTTLLAFKRRCIGLMRQFIQGLSKAKYEVFRLSFRLEMVDNIWDKIIDYSKPGFSEKSVEGTLLWATVFVATSTGTLEFVFQLLLEAKEDVLTDDQRNEIRHELESSHTLFSGKLKDLVQGLENHTIARYAPTLAQCVRASGANSSVAGYLPRKVERDVDIEVTHRQDCDFHDCRIIDSESEARGGHTLRLTKDTVLLFCDGDPCDVPVKAEDVEIDEFGNTRLPSGAPKKMAKFGYRAGMCPARNTAEQVTILSEVFGFGVFFDFSGEARPGNEVKSTFAPSPFEITVYPRVSAEKMTAMKKSRSSPVLTPSLVPASDGRERSSSDFGSLFYLNA